MDGGQHCAPVGLSFLEGAGCLQPGELLGVGLSLGQPGGCGGREGGRDVEFDDVIEPGSEG